jgi:hypothetical protein
LSSFTPSNHGVIQCTAVDAGVGADLHIVADAHAPQLLDLDPAPAVGKAEAVGTDDHTGCNMQRSPTWQSSPMVTRDFSTVSAPMTAPRSTTHSGPIVAEGCTCASGSTTALACMPAAAASACAPPAAWPREVQIRIVRDDAGATLPAQPRWQAPQ